MENLLYDFLGALYITNANGTFYYHRDHQGSIVALTDESGNIVESFAYDNHYGAIIDHTKTVETNNPYGYTGRVVDTEDLYYYRARYYDPTIQRFISEDPIGFASGDFNFYRYVADDPVDLVDPLGLASIFDIFIPDTLNAGEDEELARMARRAQKRWRYKNGKLFPVDPKTGKAIEPKYKCEIVQPERTNHRAIKPPATRTPKTFSQKIIVGVETLLRIFMHWK